ncbi:MAG: hypothetical protein ACFFC3_08325 [Candidatus Odinarchaeota archaeon]
MVIQKNKSVYLIFLITGLVLGIAAIFFLYAFNWALIIDTYQTHEGALGVVIIIGIRIIIVSLMTIYTFYSWFKQEKQYFSDMPFLFGNFFLLLIFGKLLDLFGDFTYYQNEELNFIILKARYFIAIFDLLPMIYLSIYMILISLSLNEKYKKYTDEKLLNKIKIRILIIILLIEIITGIIIPTIEILSLIYPIIVIPSLITIAWLFYFAWRNQRLSQVNTYILMIGFSLYLISSILRLLIQIIIGESTLFVIIAESIDVLIFIIMFIGFYKESDYSTQDQQNV